MAAAAGSLDYFRRGGIYPNGNTKTALDYYRRGEPIAFMGADAATSSSYSYSATGGMVLGGDASEKPAHTRLASGNAVFGNSATVQRRYVYSATGGIVLGNSVTVQPRYLYSASGGMVLGNSATSELVSGTYSHSATGNAVFGGTAIAGHRLVLITAAGGGVLAGDASEKPIYTALPVSGAVLAGTSGYQLGLLYNASGGAVFGGTATVSVTIGLITYSASGNMVLGGSASVTPPSTYSASYSATGGLVASGTATRASSYWSHNALLGSLRVTGGTASVVAPLWFYEASGNAITRRTTTNRASSAWIYNAQFWSSGPKAGVNFTQEGADYYPTTRQFNYNAQFWSEGPKAGINFQNTRSTVKSSKWNYLAQFWSEGPKAGGNFTGGTATAKCSYFAYVASGSIRTGNTSSQIVNRVMPQTSAKIATGNAAPSFLRLNFSANGASNFAGTATVMFFPIYSVGGGAVTASGTVDLWITRPTYVATGNLRIGDAAQTIHVAPTATGGMSVSGSAIAACSYFSYEAVLPSLGLYTPSYYELIDHLDPIGFWVLQDTPGSTIPNHGTSGASNYANLSGSPVFLQPSWIPNQLDGYSMRFDWLNTVARVEAGPEYLGAVSARSVSMVFRLYNVTTRSCLYDEGNSISGLNLSVVNGNLVFHVFHINPPLLDSASLSIPVNANQNYHVVAVADALSNTMKLYLNGVLVGAQALYAVAKTAIPERDVLSFGAKADGTRYNDTPGGGYATSSPSSGTGHGVRGVIQAVAVWDRALSLTEVELQQNARAARYFSSATDVHVYDSTGGMCASGAASATTWFSYLTYTAGGSITTGGVSVSNLTATFSVVVIPVGPRFGGSSTASYNYYNWLSEVGVTFPPQQSSQTLSFPVIAAGGNAVLSGGATAASSSYQYNATGGICADANFEVGVFSFGSSATGGMLLSSSATASAALVFSYNATGGMLLEPFAKFDFTFEVERGITWNINKGVLRYYRVEGKPKPNGCPPVSGICGPDQCVQYVINVTARSVVDVCDQLRKLRFKGPVKRISVMSRPVLKTDEDPAINYDCNEFVDVAIPNCDNLFLEYDLLVTAGATTYTIFTEDFTYVSSGIISASGSANNVFDQWTYVASGGILAFNDETPVYYSGKVSVSAQGGSVLGGTATYSTNALGTQLVTAGGTPMSLFAEVIFGVQSGGVLSLPDETVDSNCCGNLPSLLYMNHQMERFAKLDRFLFINDLSLRRNLRLVYSAKKNIWYNNMHFKGTGSSNDPETWNITSEFGCLDNLDGIPIQGTLWGFSFTVCNRNLRTQSDNYSRIVLGFDPSLVCTLDEAIDNTFTVNVRDQSTSPVVLRAVVLYDEIGLFKNRAFINDPSIQFRVTSTAILSPLSNINLTNSLQELLL